jgi:hypothetical protein
MTQMPMYNVQRGRPYQKREENRERGRETAVFLGMERIWTGLGMDRLLYTYLKPM